MKRNIKKFILFIIIIICFSFVGCGSNQSQSEVQEEPDGQMEVSTGSNINLDDNIEDIIEDNIINDATEVNEDSTSVNGNSSDLTTDTVVNSSDTEDITTDAEDNTEIAGNTTKDIDITVVVNNDNGDNEIVFDETSEAVYTTTDVNVRSSCSLETNNIIVALQKGTSIERIGFNTEWSKVLFQNEIRYIKTTYLSTQQPSVVKFDSDASISEDNSANENQEAATINEAASEEDFVASLDITSKIDQLICVIGNGGSDCTVSFHKKNDDGIWRQLFSTDGDNGSKGITYNKKEGDGKTPAGLYSFTLAFGIKSDPGANLPYRQITDYDYWIDDSESPYYNTWVNSLEIPGEYRSEHLIDHSPQYNFVMNINYNPDCTPGLGSAIFLHGYNGLGKTTGCIAIAEKYVKTLVKEVDSSTMILIVPNEDDLAKY